MASNKILNSKDLRSDAGHNELQHTESISVPRDIFEKLYLSPQNDVKEGLHKTFANPTPLCLAGFLLSSTPLACDLMGWRGAGGGGAASLPAYIFLGGMIQLIGGLLEFVLGNTFSFVVFSSFGGFWLSFGTTLQSSFGATEAYAATGGANSPQFAASFAFFLLSMGLLCFIYLVCSIRTNAVLVFVFTLLVLAFLLLAGAYWQIANGNLALAAKI
ncbi:Protein alcS [Lachnellula suecica]|uniref:Protein alcS n=1 Tax=Lachnellula suecica TaxID=602035 RepID=A0A8T9BYR1_9HELO|nr:Protein alcS [Lachnellula suecica]